VIAKPAPENFSEISEILPIAMVKLNKRGEVLFMNRASHELLDSMKVTPEALLQTLPHSYRSCVRQTLREGKIEETNWTWKDRSFHLIFQSSPDRLSVYMFVVDLTAQEDAKAQLIQSEKMASLGLLTAGLAHEINTPLGAIHSNNDTILRCIEKVRALLEANAPAMHLLGMLQEVCQNTSLATERLMNIVGSLKNFARLDEAELKKADIHEGLESTLTIVQHKLRGRIEVRKKYGKIPLVECYPNRLNQVFMNLLVNAAQAITDRGTITIETSRRSDSVRIAISDDGIGIPSENLSKVFDPGFTTKGVGVGTGLGLSICYKIIQQHGGKIGVESHGQETTFAIDLPIAHKEHKGKVKIG
jgi:signal transduction histidine kinase